MNVLLLFDRHFEYAENLGQQRDLFALQTLIYVLKVFGSEAFEDGNVDLGHFFQHKAIIWNKNTL